MFNLNEWVCHTTDKATYVGRVKKIVQTDLGTTYYVAFGPNENWKEFVDTQLTVCRVSFKIEV